MTARTATVVCGVILPNGQPYRNQPVSVRLNTRGFTTDGASEVVSTAYATTTPTGFTITLVINDDIDPSGTSYTVRVAPSCVWTIQLTAAHAGQTVTLRSVIVADPTNPNPISAGTGLPNVIAPGSWTNANITVDAKGRVTAAANGTGGTGGGGAVASVNAKTGAVVLTASDVGADAAGAAATAQATALSGAATDATAKANAAQAAAIQRANHTGTQSADTLTDGTTNKAYTAAERTKLAAITGTNTGDQTIPTSLPPNGAAGGDLTGTYPNPTLATAGTAGTYGSASSVPVLTTDAKGRVTAVTPTSIAIASGAVSGLATVATTGAYTDLSSRPTIPTVGAAGAGAAVALSSTDASVTNARTPTAHASTHASGGSDAITIAESQVTNLVTDLAAKPPKFNDRGTWAASTAYAISDVVTRGTLRYVTVTAHTSTTTFDATKFVALEYDLLGTLSVLPNLPPLAGTLLTTYGHSYASGIGATNNQGYAFRLNRILGGTIVNPAVSGSFMGDQVFKAKNISAVGSGIMTLDAIYNDAATSVTATAWTRSLQAFLDLTCAIQGGGSIIEDTVTTAFAYTGTWTTPNAVTGTITIAVHRTSTTGDSFTLTFYGDRCSLMLVNQSTGTTGYTVTYGGSTIASGDLVSNPGKTLGMTPTTATLQPVRLSGFGPGYHTVTVTNTGTGVLDVDCVAMPGTHPQPLVILKQPATPNLVGANLTLAQSMNTAIDTELALAWNTGKPYSTTDPSTLTGWVMNDCFYQDGTHPSDVGHNYYTQALYAAMQNYPYRWGQNSETYADLLAINGPAVTASDDFTRADNAVSAGATTVGGAQWGAETVGAVWGIASNRLAPKTSTTWSVITVQSGRSDCTITGTFSATPSGGLVARFLSNTSYILFNSDGNLYTGGNGSFASLTPATGAASAPAIGDVITLVLSGTSITVKKNGTTTATYTSSYNQTATKHGIAANATTTARWSAWSVGA